MKLNLPNLICRQRNGHFRISTLPCVTLTLLPNFKSHTYIISFNFSTNLLIFNSRISIFSILFWCDPRTFLRWRNPSPSRWESSVAATTTTTTTTITMSGSLFHSSLSSVSFSSVSTTLLSSPTQTKSLSQFPTLPRNQSPLNSRKMITFLDYSTTHLLILLATVVISMFIIFRIDSIPICLITAIWLLEEPRRTFVLILKTMVSVL